TAGAALYGGWTPRTGASLLAAGWRARRPALGQRRSDSVPHQRLGGASDAPGHPRAEPARAGVPHRARPALDGHQEFFGSGSRARLHAGASIVQGGGGEPTTLPGAGGAL